MTPSPDPSTGPRHPAHAAARGIVLSFEHQTTIAVRGPDDECFLMTMRDAAEACARARRGMIEKANLDSIQERIKKLVIVLKQWCEARTERVARCYLTVRDAGLAAFIVLPGGGFDLDLADQIDALRITLHTDFSDCPVSVSQLPGDDEEAVSSFVDMERSFVVYGKSEAG